MRGGLALEGAPIDVAGVAIRRDLTHPAAVRRVAVVMRMNGGNDAHRSGVTCSRTFLMPGPLFICMPTWTTRPDPSSAFRMRLGMVGTERHRLFLIDVLARLDRGHEVEGVLMLRRGDEHGVDRLVVEQLPEVLVGA